MPIGVLSSYYNIYMIFVGIFGLQTLHAVSF